MRSPSQINDHPHSSSCATSRDGPSNDLKTETIVESLCREPEKIWVLAKSRSHRLAKNINTLPDHVLLQMFDFYRMYPESRFPPLIETSWKWHELVHVCQRWRYIIFGSPRRLNLQLICTRGTPVRKSLGCWPPFPIAIDFYRVTSIPMFLDLPGEDDVIAALEHPDRVCRIGLNLTTPQLQKLSTVIQEPFPALTRLRLEAFWGHVLTLPNAFLGGSAPRLQSIHLMAIAFPTLPSLLSSTSDLVELHLWLIPQTGHISPNAMVASLATLTRLESLKIGFQYTLSHSSPGHLHPLPRVVLPALTEFRFLGVSEYLEDFLAQIDTPQLKNLEIKYFKQLGFQIPQLSRFLRRQELLQPTRLNNAHLEFSRDDIRIGLTSSQQPSPPRFGPKGPGLSLSIMSKGLDQQTSHLTQVFTQCFVILPNVDHLFINRLSSKLDQQGDTEWLELFSLFPDVKSLLLSEVMARHIARALDGSASGMVAEALPALRQFQILPRYQSTASVEQFISLRRLSSQPITIVNRQQEFEQYRSFFTKRGESSG